MCVRACVCVRVHACVCVCMHMHVCCVCVCVAFPIQHYQQKHAKITLAVFHFLDHLQLFIVLKYTM